MLLIGVGSCSAGGIAKWSHVAPQNEKPFNPSVPFDVYWPYIVTSLFLLSPECVACITFQWRRYPLSSDYSPVKVKR